ncbi:MAG: PEP-CTERM sorting domain-containing protein [Verrucomicrobiae bacterium]|nr:PEP-CTERM sorting domain-containing protein [Verrucomicrobiae bacterium]
MTLKLTLLILALAPLYPSAEAAIGDPGFEGTGAGPWIADNWDGPFLQNFDATDQVHGGAQALRQQANGSNVANNWEKAEAKQIFAVNPGDVINGGAWMRWANLTGNIEAFVEAKWLDAGQQELTTSSTGILGLGTVHKTSGSGNWEFQDLGTWSQAQRTAPTQARFIDLRLVLLSPGGADTATGTVWWDDAQFSVIPEPGTASLFGTGLLTALGCFVRRKSKSNSQSNFDLV